MTERPPVLHWYDLLCPFCYVAQHRNAILVRNGLEVVEMAFQIHPEIETGGIAVGPRTGPMYVALEREAAEAGLPLDWPPRLPNSRPALAAAEWVRRRQPRSFRAFQRSLFAAHFALREDIEDAAVIDRHAGASGVDTSALRGAVADGRAQAMLSAAEEAGRWHGVRGTPAWFSDGRLIAGLIAPREFERSIVGRAALGGEV